MNKTAVSKHGFRPGSVSQQRRGSSPKHIRKTILPILSLVLLAMHGCGASSTRGVPTSSVTLNVINGTSPLRNFTVHLVATTGESSAMGDLDSEGQVILKKVELGEYRVALYPKAPIDPDPESTEMQQTPIESIPKEFGDETKTPLRVTVTQSGDPIQLNLKN